MVGRLVRDIHGPGMPAHLLSTDHLMPPIMHRIPFDRYKDTPPSSVEPPDPLSPVLHHNNSSHQHESRQNLNIRG